MSLLRVLGLPTPVGGDPGQISLGDQAVVLHVADDDGAHGALADATATADALEGMLARYPDLPRTVAGLHGLTAGVDIEGKFSRDGDRIVLAFGKHQGRPLDEVARDDPLLVVDARPRTPGGRQGPGGVGPGITQGFLTEISKRVSSIRGDMTRPDAGPVALRQPLSCHGRLANAASEVPRRLAGVAGGDYSRSTTHRVRWEAAGKEGLPIGGRHGLFSLAISRVVWVSVQLLDADGTVLHPATLAPDVLQADGSGPGQVNQLGVRGS